MGYRESWVVEWVTSVLSNWMGVIILYRQVPGLWQQPSKHKKRLIPNTMEHTRPNPLKCVLAQCGRHHGDEVIIGQHHGHQ